MSETWRSIGGTQNYQQLNNINAATINTGTLTVREAYLGIFYISGYLNVTNDVKFYSHLSVYKNAYIYGNTFQKQNLYLGSNSIHYLYGTDTGIGIDTMSPSGTLHIYGNIETTFIAQNSLKYIENYPALTIENNGISVGGNSVASFVHFYETNNGTVGNPNTALISTMGNLYVETEKTTIFRSRVIVANKEENPQHVSIENFTIYDTPTEIFRYDIYGNLFGKTGTCITGLAREGRSTTFYTLNSLNYQGFGLGGGIIPDKNFSIGVLGTYNIQGTYNVAQTFLSQADAGVGNNIIKKMSIGVNNISPQMGKYIMDINGPIQIRMAEINNQFLENFEIKFVTFCETNKNYAIAVGSPYNVTSPYKQYIFYSTNGGISWNSSRVLTDETTDDLENTVSFFYAASFQSPEFVVIAGTNNYMYYSTNYGASWTKYTYYYDYLDFVEEDNLRPITVQSLYTNSNVVFGTYKNLDTDYTAQRGFFAYIPDPSDNTIIDSGSSIRYKINTLYNSDLDFVCADGYGDYLYFLANSDSSGSYLFVAEFDYSSMNFVYDLPTPYTNFSSATFYHHIKNSYAEYLVGNYIYYKNAGDIWTQSTYTPSNGVYIKHVSIIDENNAIAVGTAGTIIYTKNGGINWTQIPTSLLDAYGNSSILINSSIDLLHIYPINTESFLVSYSSVSYDSSYSITGESKIYHMYVPTIFNRSSTILMDICGSMRITGDLMVEEGGDTTLDGTLLVRQEVTANKNITVFSTDTNMNYYVSIGSIANPDEQVSQGTLLLQGQNGMGAYNTWKFQVGTTEAITSNYNAKRLRIIDETNNGKEIMTIDTNGYVGIATQAPTSTLDVSGITTVSIETESTGLGNGSLIVHGGTSINKNTFIGGILTIVNNTDSTDISNGSIVTYGGVGIQKSVHIGGNVSILDNTIVTGTTTPAALKIPYGGVSIGTGSLYIGGNITIENSTAAISPTQGALIISNGGGVAVSGSIYTGGNVTILDQITATHSTAPAALQIPYGGVAIGTGSLYIGGNITIENTTASVSPTTGALLVYGGTGIQGNLYIEQIANCKGTITTEEGLYVTNTYDTNVDFFINIGSILKADTQVSQGSLLLQGKNGLDSYNTWKLQVGAINSATSAYDTKRLRFVDETNDAQERMTIDTNGYVGIGTAAPLSLLDVSGGITNIRGDTTSIVSSSTSAAALRVAVGGAAVAGSIYTGGNVTIQDYTIATGAHSPAALQIQYGGAAIAGSLYMGGNVTIQNSTAAISTSHGAFIISNGGGAAISGSVYTGGNVTIQDKTVATGTYAPAALQIPYGGMAMGEGSLYIGGNITVENKTIPTGAYSPAALKVLYGGAAIGGSLYTGGNITVQNTTASVSPTTGSLLVYGGAGIQGDVYVGKTVYATDTVTTEKGIYVTSTDSYTDFFVSIGSINDPTSQISQGTILIQGQNGMNDYNTWKFQVGTTDATTSTYDTKRLRIIDETNDAQERMTIDSNGYIGIGTSTPISLLDVSGGITNIEGDGVSIVSSSTSAAALRVSIGGAAIAGSIYTGGNITIQDKTAATGASNTAAFQIPYGGAAIGGSLYVGGNITIQNTIAAISPTQGAFIISNGGGAAISGSIYTGGNVTIQNTIAATGAYAPAALQIPYGGVAIGSGSLYIGGNITIQNQTAATGATSPAAFQVPYGGAAIGGSLYVGGNITIQNTTAAVSTTTGCFLLSGGAGIQGNLYVGEKIYSNDIQTSTLEVTGTDSGADYSVTIGSIADPTSIISKGSLYLQGQNGMENFGIWNISVGTILSGTSSYDTTRLVFEDVTQSEERMTIDMNGYVGIGTSSPSSLLHVNGTVLVEENLMLYGNIVTSDGTYILATSLADTVSATSAISYSSTNLTTSVSSDLYIRGNLYATSYNTVSDYRYKQNIEDLSIEEFNTKRLRPVKYYNTILQREDIGLIAHDLQKIYPNMVTGEKDGDTIQTINYQNLIVLLMNDIKELREKVEKLSMLILDNNKI